MKILYAFFPWINQHLFLFPTRWFLKYFLHLRVRGFENVLNHKHRRVIFAANHSSELDPIILTSTFPFLSQFLPMFYVSRARKHYKHSGMKRLLYGGLFFRLWGAFPTFSGKHDYEFALTHHIRILDMNMPILIFPEGGIKRKKENKEPRGGVAFLAERVNAVVIPVHITGVEDMTSAEFYGRERTCTVTFGKPLWFDSEVSEQEGNRYKQIAQYVVDQIYSL